MSTHQGVVEVINENKAGYYSIKLPDAWYGTGDKKAPAVAVGDMVKFEWEANGNFKNIKRGTLTKLDGPASGNSQPKRNWVPDEDRQKSIIYQSSRKDAIEIIKAAQAAGCLALPTKKNEQFDALLALVDELTVQLATKATAADLTSVTNNTNNNGDSFDG